MCSRSIVQTRLSTSLKLRAFAQLSCVADLIFAHQPPDRSDGESFVVKRMPRAFYELSQRLADQFAHSCRLRLHIDHNEEAGILIYTYFNNTLLDLIRGDDELPGAEVQKVLRHVGEAIQEFHLEDWVHLGTPLHSSLADTPIAD